MQPFYEKDAYVNDLGEEGEQRVREAYGKNYGRLVALKNKYDPTNRSASTKTSSRVKPHRQQRVPRIS